MPELPPYIQVQGYYTKLKQEEKLDGRSITFFSAMHNMVGIFNYDPQALIRKRQ
jgi:hypothetical protein